MEIVRSGSPALQTPDQFKAEQLKARQMLRGESWCRMEAVGGFIHVGYDYYMYLGVERLCSEAVKLAARVGDPEVSLADDAIEGDAKRCKHLT